MHQGDASMLEVTEPDDIQDMDSPSDVEQGNAQLPPDGSTSQSPSESDESLGDGGKGDSDVVANNGRDLDGGEHLDATDAKNQISNTGELPDGSSPQDTQDASDTDANAAKELAKSHDPCRRPEECTNGGDVNDVWNVMTCFAPWQPRPIGVNPMPGCQNLGCADGFRCQTDGNCEAITCDATPDCAEDFACSTGGTCQRISCTSDDDCDAFCVSGGCSQTLGICDYQSAA